MYICKRCKIEKEKNEFVPGRNICKLCKKKYDHEYHIKNKDSIQKRNKDWRKNNSKTIKEKKKNNYALNKDNILNANKKWMKNNKNRRLEYQKQYLSKNIDKIKKRRKENYFYNKQKKLIDNKIWRDGKSIFKTYGHKLIFVDKIFSDKQGFILAECITCKKEFYPSNSQIRARIFSIEGKKEGENRLYCSNECKKNCSIYRRSKYRKNEVNYNLREKSSEFDKIVFEERNNECEKCSSKEKLQIHHIKGYTQYPELRFDLNNVILLCKSCHKKIHQQDGCNTFNLKCK